MTPPLHVAPPTRIIITLTCLLLAGVGSLGVGCARDDSPTLQIYAASSLTDAFRNIAREFEAASPNSPLALSFGGSHLLRTQIAHGAPANVYATADTAHLDTLRTSGIAGEGTPFAEGELVLIIASHMPTSLTSFEQLGQVQRIVIGTPHSPIGRYTRTLLREASQRYGDSFAPSVMARVVSEETNSRLVRAKVELGDADAAIVYASDALGRPNVRTISIPESLRVRVQYSAALVNPTPPSQDFLDFLHTPTAATLLERHGFHVE